MSNWLKWRLIALFGAVALCGGASYLHAQNDYPAPAKTPEAAGEQFFVFLAAGKVGAGVSPRFDWGQAFRYTNSVSRAQMLAVSNRSQNGGPERFFASLAEQATLPQFSGRVSGQENGKTLVEVVPGAIARPREVVVIAEDGGYRVDVFATYGKWNNLSASDLGSEIYRYTGIASDALRGDANFVRAQCQTNMKQIMLGVLQYSQDYDERLPRARAWTDILQPYVKSRQIFTCPALTTGKTNGYAFNQNLSQISELRIKQRSAMVSVYETSNLGENVFGPGTGRAYRHKGGANFAFADGHIKWFARGSDATLSFKP